MTKEDEARLLELVDKQDLGSCGRNSVRVRLPYLALKNYKSFIFFFLRVRCKKKENIGLGYYFVHSFKKEEISL